MTILNDEENNIINAASSGGTLDLSKLQLSFLEITGKQFKHFFCPFLHLDEKVELCRGHIIPESYSNSPNTRVIQRADIDNFYGAFAEAELGKFFKVKDKELSKVLFDPELSKILKPEISIDGDQISYYRFNGEICNDHTRVVINNPKDNCFADLVFKTEPDNFHRVANVRIIVSVEKDFRIAAIVTILRSAYLTMFYLLEYNWALSSAGIEIGYSLLGKFFRENKSKNKVHIQNSMKQLFLPFKHTVRPIATFGDQYTPLGTLCDNVTGLCYGISDRPFAHLVYVYIVDRCYAALLPLANNPDSAATYWEFLNSENEKLIIRHTQFDSINKCWRINPEPIIALWPKSDASFGF